jgi:hypothetical protein
MAKGRTDWIVVNLDGLSKTLVQRGPEFVIYELASNVMDENATRMDITLTRPVHGKAFLSVADDSPEGFRDLTDAYMMYGESYKKADPEKRGRYDVGEKCVLALCSEASITTTTGQVVFNEKGRKVNLAVKRPAGSEFRGQLALTLGEYEQMCEAVRKLMPSIPTYFNGELIPVRKPLRTWKTTLETVKSDAAGNLRRTERATEVSVYEVLSNEKAHVYEMGIPVVELSAKYHVSVAQKVPLNVDRDNVKPAYLRAIYVELLNHTTDLIAEEDANAVWVRTAASDPRCTDTAIKTVMDLRFGENRVSYDMNDVGSNREAASKSFTVITGGSLSKGEWENAKRANAITPAGTIFPTDINKFKTPAKVYSRNEWTPAMEAFADFVEVVSPYLIGGKKSHVRYIRDRAITLCGSFQPMTCDMTVNLAHHEIGDWQKDIDLMIHEMAHDTVQTNDHLCAEFYETTCRIGAKLALLAVDLPDLFACTRPAVVAG